VKQHRLPSESLKIADLVDQVYAELQVAADRGAATNRQSVFRVHGIDLEVNVLVRASEQTKTGLVLEPITAEQTIEDASEHVQKVTLHLESLPGVVREIPPSGGTRQ
jgi:hypothetical protein